MKRLQRKWKVYLVHHTHSDIGYTHTQNEVIRLQKSHLDKSLELIEANMNRPEHERFRWSPEVTWIFEEWLSTATDEQKEKFVKYVQEGYIGIDAFYVNLLTGLCRPLEIERNFDYMKKLEEMTNTQVDSAMITDIPGWNWGIVNSLSNNGIKYLSLGTNRSDRIGHIIEQFGDKPFYWQSKEKQHKVLAWVHGKGYSWFHTGLKSTKNLSRKLKPSRMNRYLSSLENDGYPYDIVIIRYAIGQDNGPTDSNLCSIVEKWNKEHPEMELHIATNSQAFNAFEKAFGNKLPVLCGDISPYWEDGAMSTSHETALARRAGEKLTVVEKLASNFDVSLDTSKMYSAWRNTLFFNEHTWGAYNSISKPEHEFAKSQWAWKQQYAVNAFEESNEIYCNVVEVLCKSNDVEVYNPHEWSVSRLVEVKTKHCGVVDENGTEVLSQKLGDDILVFVANIEGASKKVYTLTNNKCVQEFDSKIKIDFDENEISSIKYFDNELINSNEHLFNEYLFATGKWGRTINRNNPSFKELEVIEEGSLYGKYIVYRDGYLAKSIKTTVEINYFNEEVKITNCVDRIKSTKKEGVYFAFPFQIDNAQIRYDGYYNDCLLEKEQLEGSNKNFITATRYVDVSNDKFGVTMYLADAPIFKTEKLYKDPFRSGPAKLCGWKTEITKMDTVYSYVMNNYWMTNYKAYQEGEISFSYTLRPHYKYEEDKARKFSFECAQPLVVGYKGDQL